MVVTSRCNCTLRPWPVQNMVKTVNSMVNTFLHNKTLTSGPAQTKSGGGGGLGSTWVAGSTTFNIFITHTF